MSIPTITPETPYVDISLSRVGRQRKSNLNTFFGKGRQNKSTGKVIPRDWYEVELIVDKKTSDNPIYPKGDFIAHTDDGLTFACQTQGANYKNFRSKDDLTILGRWIKGKLEKSGVLKQFEPVTIQTIKAYGRDYIRLYKLSNSEYYLEFDLSIHHKRHNRLKELHLKWVGTAPEFDVHFAKRLNLFTGDNGLGKTFLLDIAWWGLTGNWVGQPAWPQQIEGKTPEETPEITYMLSSQTDSEEYRSLFSFFDQQWLNLRIPPFLRSLIVYVRVDGGFSVFDPVRQQSSIYNFTSDHLWNGLRTDNKVLCNGLIHDWVNWQRQREESTFEIFSSVIRQLSPHADEWMEPGKPIRVSVEDTRDIPTLDFPYGNVPIIYTSAGIKRILGLAYLLMWTWYEHTQASKLRQQEPIDQIVFLIDEVEAHLHPAWQRSILPAILEVVKSLKNEMQVQLIATTHSPLVLASIEPEFDEEQDKLFLFELQGKDVTLNEVPWTKHGDAVGWLTSDIFGLKQARSREAEIAIEAAYTFMRGESMETFPEYLRTKEQIHQELLGVLPEHDRFWPRWIVSTEVE
ncbi:AAA family ATPase [Microcoleus sp. LAD1_D5]|uniref:AAA family ATPase n=1 Tax=unclassified Microcoleus TaxID=2642155 RepID=UPI002FD06A0D